MTELILIVVLCAVYVVIILSFSRWLQVFIDKRLAEEDRGTWKGLLCWIIYVALLFIWAAFWLVLLLLLLTFLEGGLTYGL